MLLHHYELCRCMQNLSPSVASETNETIISQGMLHRGRCCACTFQVLLQPVKLKWLASASELSHMPCDDVHALSACTSSDTIAGLPRNIHTCIVSKLTQKGFWLAHTRRCISFLILWHLAVACASGSTSSRGDRRVQADSREAKQHIVREERQI